MINAENFIRNLKKLDINFFSGVPETILLKQISENNLTTRTPSPRTGGGGVSSTFLSVIFVISYRNPCI